MIDQDGTEAKSIAIESISTDQEGVVTCINGERHLLREGDQVRFSDLKGMTKLNDTIRTIKVIDPFKFSIGDTSDLGHYSGGGRATEVKQERFVDFVSQS